MDTEQDIEDVPLVQFVWLTDDLVLDYYARIVKVGTPAGSRREDPEETGDGYRRVDCYDLPDGSWAEVFFLDPRGGAPADIRIAVRIDEDEMAEYEKSPRYEGITYGTYALAKAMGLTDAMDRDLGIRCSPL